MSRTSSWCVVIPGDCTQLGELRQIDIRGPDPRSLTRKCLGRRAPDPLRGRGHHHFLLVQTPLYLNHHREISSSAKSRVFGPKPPIVTIMIAMAAAINRATAGVPPSFKKNPISNPAKAALTRLQL